MFSLPIRAFVFKGFISLAAILLMTCVFICLPGDFIGAEESAPLPSIERGFEPTVPSEASETSPTHSEPKKTFEPTRIDENVPYKFPFEDEKGENEAPEQHFFGQFMKMLGTLGVLIAVMVAASWSLKRMLNTRVQQLNDTSLIKVVETRTLSNKSSLHLVEIEGKTFFIGESMNNITLLATLPNKPEETH